MTIAVNRPFAKGINVADNEARLAAAYLGVDPTTILTVFHNTAEHNQAGATLFATASTAVTVQAGSYRLATLAVAAQTINLVLAGPGRSSFARTGQNWFTSGRFAVTSAITAQTRATVGLVSSANASQADMGVSGAVSTSFFSLAGAAGGNIVTTVAIDTNFHTHRAWRVGGTTYYMIDNSIFAGSSDLGSASSPGVDVENGTDATARSLDVIWFGASAPQQ